MRIGGAARYFVELKTKKDAEDVVIFTEETGLPLVMLGGGSNTIFADGMIEAVVARVVADRVDLPHIKAPHPNPLPPGEGILVHVEAGKILASFLNELAEQNLDLSPLTGIPGTVGGAVFGNAGQGFGGTWIGSFVKDVTFYHKKQWKTWKREECGFGYRESVFKTMSPPIIWSVTLSVPTRPQEEIQAERERFMQKRMATQPHVKTAGSCFKSLPNGTPAWKLIDAAGLRGFRVGDIQVAEKHANFLLNTGKATFDDATILVQKIQSHMGQPLDVEMRLVKKDGSVLF